MLYTVLSLSVGKLISSSVDKSAGTEQAATEASKLEKLQFHVYKAQMPW